MYIYSKSYVDNEFTIEFNKLYQLKKTPEKRVKLEWRSNLVHSVVEVEMQYSRVLKILLRMQGMIIYVGMKRKGMDHYAVGYGEIFQDHHFPFHVVYLKIIVV